MLRAFFRRLPLLASLVVLLSLSFGGLHAKSAYASCGASVTKAYTTNTSNSPQTVFNYGDTVRYVANVYNSCSSSLTITLGFFATWGNITGFYRSQIFNHTYTFSVPSGTSGWYVSQTISTSTTFPGIHTYQASLYNSGQPYSQASSTFHVKGTRVMTSSSGYPATSSQYFISQFAASYDKGHDCGPATVAMMLMLRGKNPLGLTGGALVDEVRKTIVQKFGNNGDTTGPQLYFALENYWDPNKKAFYPTGIIGQSIGQQNPQPLSQENWIEGSMTANRAIAILVNACSATCPAGSVDNVPSPNIGRKYAGHWLEVIGTYDDGTNTYFEINDPDNSSTGTNGNEPVIGWVASNGWPTTAMGNAFHYIPCAIECDNYEDISGQ